MMELHKKKSAEFVLLLINFEKRDHKWAKP